MGNVSDSPIRKFTTGKLTHGRLNESIDVLEDHSRRLNALEGGNPGNKIGLPLPCKVTDVVSAGKYYADAYLPPYRPSEPDPENIADLEIADLGDRTVQVILWNLSELGGGSSLQVGQVVDASIAGFDPSGFPLMKTGGGGSASSFTPIYARIASYLQDGDNKRWVYTFVEVEKTAIGYDGWEDVEDGLEGTCLNMIEDQNGETGLWGNGVNSMNLADTSLDIQPIPVGTRIMLFTLTFTVGESTETEYWFSVPNGIDGGC